MNHIDPADMKAMDFRPHLARFNALLAKGAGGSFTRFDEGLIAAWESYKPRLRELALERLGTDEWQEGQIGSGEILERVIAAIEIQSAIGDETNNLVFWQNRYGHANRDHHKVLEARLDKTDRQAFERLFFDLYRNNGDEAAIFDDLRDRSGGKYPLLAYLFFLKDMTRFTPIQPTGFDRVFAEMGIDFHTLRQCSWENYATFNAILTDLIAPVEAATGLSNVRLIDVHSLLWVFTTFLKMEAAGELEAGPKVSEKYLGARERSILEIKLSVGKTASNSNGQLVQKLVKDKKLLMDDKDLDRRIRDLLDLQGDRCSITGLPFQFRGAHTDENMLPSLDRIDSNGHYEANNVQLVCRFINFWKQASPDGEFRRLMNIVRGIDLDEKSSPE